MKQLFTILALTCLTAVANAQAGRIKVSFVGFDCYRETWDDILHTDGKGDEVYFNFNFAKSGKGGNLINKFDKRTQVYGDATGAFSNRISAGSMTDLFGNNKGGIRGGDQYRCNDVVGEMDLADGDFVILTPTAWEHDPIADNSNAFYSTIGSMYVNISQKLAPVMLTLNALHGNFAGVIFNAVQLGMPKVRAGGEQGELGRPGTRPIGMEKYGDFNAQFVALNSRTIQEFTTTDAGYGRGVIAVNYNEEMVGNSRDHGNYSILLKVEWFPKANSGTNTAPPPAPSGSGNVPPPNSGNSGYVPPPNTGSNNNSGYVPPPPPPSSNSYNRGAASTGGSYVPPPANTSIKSGQAGNAATKAAPAPAVNRNIAPAPAKAITTAPVTNTAPAPAKSITTVAAPAPAGNQPQAGEIKQVASVRQVSAGSLNKLNNNSIPVRAASANPSLSGKWQSNDLGPDNWMFELLENGEMIIRSADGKMTGKGTYSINGNSFTASSTSLTSKQTLGFTGIYDAASGQLSVNSGKGKGVLVKK